MSISMQTDPNGFEKATAVLLSAVTEDNATNPDQVLRTAGIDPEGLKAALAATGFEPAKHPYRLLTNQVIKAIFKEAIDGNVSSQKLWLQLMEGWPEGFNATANPKEAELPMQMVVRPMIPLTEKL